MGGPPVLGQEVQQMACLALGRAKTGGEIPDLAFDVDDDERAAPVQRIGHDNPDIFAASRGRCENDALLAWEDEITSADLPKDHAMRAEKARVGDLTGRRKLSIPVKRASFG